MVRVHPRPLMIASAAAECNAMGGSSARRLVWLGANHARRGPGFSVVAPCQRGASPVSVRRQPFHHGLPWIRAGRGLHASVVAYPGGGAAEFGSATVPGTTEQPARDENPPKTVAWSRLPRAAVSVSRGVEREACPQLLMGRGFWSRGRRGARRGDARRAARTTSPT